MTGGSTVRDVHATVYVDARARRAAAAVLAVRPDPVADAGFVGRSHEMTELLDLLAPHPGAVDSDDGEADTGGVVVVSAVAGAPGVGKTALAQAAARTATARGWFPGGAVTVDLHGYDPDPAQVIWPAQLYAGLLRALGVASEQIPPTESDQATAYHQLLDQLADDGRAVLLVWDNVADPDQIVSMLPRGVGGHRVLITSRDTLAALPNTRLLDLQVLDRDVAVALLAVGLRRRHEGDTRTAGDPAAADRLVELCGQLPLAVQIVAALLGDEPDRPLAAAVAELADERHRLQGLDYGGRWAVRAAFDLSYRRLDPPVAELFRWLAAAPGPDVGLVVAAVVADQDQAQTRAGLRALCRAHLLDHTPTPRGVGEVPRWRMHDLIRLYAAEHLGPDQRAAGFARALAHYRHTAGLAERRFTALPARSAAVPAGFTSAPDAMAWVLAERAGLVATVLRAVDTHPDDAVQLAGDLDPFLQRDRLLADRETVAAAAVEAARRCSKRTLAANAWNNLGNALREVRRFEEAITAHEQARAIFQELGDRHSEGAAWGNLGSALREVRRFGEAVAAHEQARTIFQELGDRHREGMAWGNLGVALQEVRRFEEAITAYERDIAICAELDDHYGQAQTLANLGEVYTELDDPERARGAWANAAKLYTAAGVEDDAARMRQRIADLTPVVGRRRDENW